MTRTLSALVLLSLAGCSNGYLQYDFGRCYTEVSALQADRTRQSVVGSEYVMVGHEAELIRMQVVKQTTDEESGRAEATDSAN